MEELASEAQRRQAIAWAISLTANTPLEPEDYEQYLLKQYAHGVLTLDEVLEQVDSQVGHILYVSTATHPFSDAKLVELLTEMQLPNEQHSITGLLCYSQGHFVQLLEGPPPAINTLFANIQRDTRHHHVVCLRGGAGPTRWFPDWSMALLQPDPVEFYWVTNLLEARRNHLREPLTLLEEPHLITEAHLLTLLHAFSAL